MGNDDDPQTLSINDIIDRAVAQTTARRADGIGLMADRVLNAADPDGAFLSLAREAIECRASENRRLVITALAKAFGADRKKLKRYLRAHGVCGEKD